MASSTACLCNKARNLMCCPLHGRAYLDNEVTLSASVSACALVLTSLSDGLCPPSVSHINPFLASVLLVTVLSTAAESTRKQSPRPVTCFL